MLLYFLVNLSVFGRGAVVYEVVTLLDGKPWLWMPLFQLLYQFGQDFASSLSVNASGINNIFFFIEKLLHLDFGRLKITLLLKDITPIYLNFVGYLQSTLVALFANSSH